jgi:hypothetical protein
MQYNVAGRSSRKETNMKKFAVIAMGILLGGLAQATTVDFETFNIRNSNGTITAPWDSDLSIVENAAGDGFLAMTPQGGQKVGYGTSAFDGCQLNDFETVNWTKVSGKAGVVTYLNIWVTDGNGNYAVISSENDYRGTDFATRDEWKIFEYSGTNFDWLFDSGTGGRSSQYLTLNGSNATLADISDDVYVYAGPGVGATGVGTGAPQGGYGFNLIFGDTQSNFVGNYEIKDLSVDIKGSTYYAGAPIPEPATISLMLLGMGGLAIRHRRKQ